MKKAKPQMSEEEILDLLDLIPKMDSEDIVRVLELLQAPVDRRVKAAFEKRIEKIGRSKAKVASDLLAMLRLIFGGG